MLLYSYERKGIILLVVFIASMLLIPRLFLKANHDLVLKPIDYPLVQPATPQTKKLQIVELNSADSASLVKIRGIGGYYASKIIKYRVRLGGYVSVNQLKELKMTYFNVDSLRHCFTVDTSLIRKKDLNALTFKEILAHPYLEYEDVQQIFRAKNKNGGSVSMKILKENATLPDYKLRKIQPYFY
ncbi:MAG: helix-hairpin-helix domain-containing protein [Culturomica sp.]|jgi:hypothetical protein|nr:helix-hairpin-helix domain-containing protein [Culturomica sp.]